MKPETDGLALVSEDSEMKNHALILKLREYRGDVKVDQNTFEDVTFKFKSWATAENTIDYDIDNLWYIDGTVYTKQAKSLISLIDIGNIEITGNTFTRCNSGTGLINIVRLTDDSFISIIENTFIQNSNLLMANLIRYLSYS